MFRGFRSNGKLNFYLGNYKKKTHYGKYLKTFTVPLKPYLMAMTFKYERQKEVVRNVPPNTNKHECADTVFRSKNNLTFVGKLCQEK